MIPVVQNLKRHQRGHKTERASFSKTRSMIEVNRKDISNKRMINPHASTNHFYSSNKRLAQIIVHNNNARSQLFVFVAVFDFHEDGRCVL